MTVLLCRIMCNVDSHCVT